MYERVWPKTLKITIKHGEKTVKKKITTIWKNEIEIGKISTISIATAVVAAAAAKTYEQSYEIVVSVNIHVNNVRKIIREERFLPTADGTHK